MKKKIILSAISIFSLCSSFSQIGITFTKENINPNFFEGHIPFLSVDFAPSKSNFFADFGIKFKASGFYANAEYRIAYLNGLEKYMFQTPEPTANSIYSYKSPKSININLGYMVMQKEADAKVLFKLKSSGKVSYYAKAYSKKTKYLMVDLGFRKGYSWVHCKGKKLKFEGVNLPDGFTPPAPENVRTMMDFTMLQIGLSAGSIGAWEADIDGYGHRRANKFVRYYLDMLVLLGSTVDAVNNGEIVDTQSQTTIYTQYDLNNTERSKVGFCLGASLNNISRFGIEGGLEMGYYPGMKGSFGSNFGFSIKSSLSLAALLN